MTRALYVCNDDAHVHVHCVCKVQYDDGGGRNCLVVHVCIICTGTRYLQGPDSRSQTEQEGVSVRLCDSLVSSFALAAA